MHQLINTQLVRVLSEHLWELSWLSACFGASSMRC